MFRSQIFAFPTRVLCVESFSVAVLCLAGILASASAPAYAGLQICNQTSYVLYAATGVQQSAKIATHGWTRVVPGDCATAIAEPLRAPAYFVYARSLRDPAGQSRAWGGQFQLCAKETEFSLETPASTASCKADGAEPLPFAPVQVNKSTTWTMTLTETANLVTPDDARNAGLARLLGEIGIPAAANNRDLGAALARFRAQAGLPANAKPDDEFAALERAVRKAPVSKGYAICNDGDAKIWAAVGVKNGNQFVSHGWWGVEAGDCTLAVPNALGRDPVYLYASRHGNRSFVAGSVDFCISENSFDIPGRDHCAERHFTVQGFAATNARGLPGFTAHIGNAGLTTP